MKTIALSTFEWELQKWGSMLYEKFVFTLCCSGLCLWFTLVVNIILKNYRKTKNVKKCVACPIIPMRCKTLRLIIPPTCAYYSARFLGWKVTCHPPFMQLVPRVIIGSINGLEGTRLLSNSFPHYKSIWFHRHKFQHQFWIFHWGA